MNKKIIALSTLALISATSITSFANTSDKEYKSEIKLEQNQPRAQYSVVNANNVNLRKTPSTSGQVIRKLQKGNLVLEYSVPTVSANGYRWQKVSYKGSVGWVATKYLTPEGA
ncbi:MAG: SH3 domain-containing protein [Bacilli bacterium]